MENTMLEFFAYALMVLGLIGSLLPVVPGPVFIWLGVLTWAWSDGFQAIGWPTLLFWASLPWSPGSRTWASPPSSAAGPG